jgi:phosphoserine aminotransferase
MHAKNRSVLNTPPVFAIYTSLLTLRWIKKVGLSNLLQQNEKKATTLYSEIDRNPLFEGTVVNKSDRSKMNVCFTMKQPELETQFLQLCTSQNIEGIAGHRSVGGFRASLYNAVSLNDVEKLVSLMQEFEQSKIQ